MLELWLIRHGETIWRLEQRTQGHSQNPLSAQGRAQAARLGERLRDVSFDLIYTSDLKRATETASLALPGRELTSDRRLRELAGGYLEGRTLAELTAEERTAYEAWQQDPYRLKRGGGESFADLQARVLVWLESLPSRGRVAAFTHGGVIRTLLLWLLGLERVATLTIQVDYTGISRLRLSEASRVIVSVNDVAHLERPLGLPHEKPLAGKLKAEG